MYLQCGQGLLRAPWGFVWKSPGNKLLWATVDMQGYIYVWEPANGGGEGGGMQLVWDCQWTWRRGVCMQPEADV